MRNLVLISSLFFSLCDYILCFQITDSNLQFSISAPLSLFGYVLLLVMFYIILSGNSWNKGLLPSLDYPQIHMLGSSPSTFSNCNGMGVFLTWLLWILLFPETTFAVECLCLLRFLLFCWKKKNILLKIFFNGWRYSVCGTEVLKSWKR